MEAMVFAALACAISGIGLAGGHLDTSVPLRRAEGFSVSGSVSGRRPGNVPLVIAHRGASGERPEHTLEAYRLAIRQGADYIEPDLVITRDGVLICRHENELSETTDIASRPVFAWRKRTKLIDGRPVTGWFSEDFTLEEIRTLRARERWPELRPRSAAYDGQFLVPTFAEVCDLALEEGRKRGRPVGIYPELKHPSWFRSIRRPLEEPLVAELERRGWTGPDAPVFVQSFEPTSLLRFRPRIRTPLVQLVAPAGAPFDMTEPRNRARYPELATYAAMARPEGLRSIARYAQGIGPNKALVLPRLPDGRLGSPTTLVRDAHRLGLAVHVWTMRDEEMHLPADARGNPAEEYRRFLKAGVDGFFTDFPATARRALGEAPSPPGSSKGAGGR